MVASYAASSWTCAGSARALLLVGCGLGVNTVVARTAAGYTFPAVSTAVVASSRAVAAAAAAAGQSQQPAIENNAIYTAAGAEANNPLGH